jgi:5-methylcytosine-specific restriction endonuclease McrA
MRKKGWKLSEETRKRMSLAQLGHKGVVHTPETKERIRQAQLGKVYSPETLKKISIANTGKVRTAEMRKRIGLASLGRKANNETKAKLRAIHLGRKHSKEWRLGTSGEKHWNWKGGITPINHKIRTSFEYKLWRKAVFERDNYTCKFCGTRGGIIHADHIKPFALFPELRFAIDNGRTLCKPCHQSVHRA